MIEDFRRNTGFLHKLEESIRTRFSTVSGIFWLSTPPGHPHGTYDMVCNYDTLRLMLIAIGAENVKDVRVIDMDVFLDGLDPKYMVDIAEVLANPEYVGS